jgi:hypothetical protein
MFDESKNFNGGNNGFKVRFWIKTNDSKSRTKDGRSKKSLTNARKFDNG